MITYGPVNPGLYFLYGFASLSLCFWGKVFHRERWIALASIFEDSQFKGFWRAYRDSSYTRTRKGK